jgi:hypothetical protein
MKTKKVPRERNPSHYPANCGTAISLDFPERQGATNRELSKMPSVTDRFASL